MSNCHSKYSNRNNIECDNLSFFLGIIDDFSKKRTNLLRRRSSPLIYPLNYLFSKSYKFYGLKTSNLNKKIKNNYVSTLAYDRDSVRRRVRHKIKLIRLKNTIKYNKIQ
mgnify:FL=1